jgi:hypothetical protein
MPGEVLPGRPGNLTAEQEEKLRRLWHLIFQVCGVQSVETTAAATEAPGEAVEKAEVVKDEKPKKKRLGIFSRRSKKDVADAEPAADTASAVPAVVTVTPVKDGADDKYGQTKQFYETLANQSPETLRKSIWSMVKHDHPDALALRFLRARKWDVEKALVMLVSTLNWRAQEMKVDDDIMRNGEGAAAEEEKSTDPAVAKLAGGFLAQMRMGKSFIHGIDKDGRPICVVRVRLHKQGDHPDESLERNTVFVIETARFLLTPPVDTAVSRNHC